MSKRIIYLVFLLFLKNSLISAQSATCEYSINNIFVYISKFAYYSCKIELENSQEIDRIEEIDGIHKDNKTNQDVKFLHITSEDSNLNEFSLIFCDTFVNLEGIKVEKLAIASIDDDSLQACQSLKLLTLNDNGIRDFPENFLSENANLLEFEFSSNKISTVPEDAFEMLENLLKLSLQNNKISHLPDGVFKSLSKLEQLNLDNNKLEELNSKWFKNFKNLIKLTINHNIIQNLPEEVFGNLHNLTMLEMKNNQLTEIHASSFGNRAKLQALFLENNFIRSIDPKFMHESSISMLHMEGNFCFSGNTKARDESMDTNVKRCFKNHKPTVKTTSTTSTTTVAPTTTISKLITTTLKSSTTETTTTKKPKTTTIISQVPKITEETSTTPIIEKESLISSVQLTSSAQTFSQSTESSIVTTTRSPKSIVAFKHPCGKVQYGIPALSDGEKYVRGQFPWNVAIFQTNGKFICSGVLVDKRKVVTAAKCMYKIVRDTPIELLPRDIIVILGSHNIYKLFETQKLSVAVQTIHIHKDFKFESTNMDADIAVIILDTEINSGKFIKPICLIDSDENILSISDGYLATFGHNNSMAMNHNFTPRKLEIQIRDNLDCVISNEAFAYISSDRTFCALPNDEADVCVEDYGSGLYVKYEGSYYLRGILSTAISDGKSKCIVGSDSLYTDVSKYSKWIEELPLYAYEDVVDEYFGLVWT